MTSIPQFRTHHGRLGFEIQTVALRITLAEVYIRANCHLLALSHVLASQTLSLQYNLDSLHAAATVSTLDEFCRV